MNTEEAKKYMSGYEKLRDFFGVDILEKAFKTENLEDYQVLVNVDEEKAAEYRREGYSELGIVYIYEEEWSGEWHREMTVKKYKFLIPKKQWNYSMFAKCMKLRWGYLKGFHVLYGGSSENSEIYILCGHEYAETLYVPVEALVKNDKSIIVDRMLTYWKGYCERNYPINEAETVYKKQINALNTKEAKKLFAILDKKKTIRRSEEIK